MSSAGAFRSCKDLYEHGYGSDGVYTIEDLSGSSYTVSAALVDIYQKISRFDSYIIYAPSFSGPMYLVGSAT